MREKDYVVSRGVQPEVDSLGYPATRVIEADSADVSKQSHEFGDLSAAASIDHDDLAWSRLTVTQGLQARPQESRLADCRHHHAHWGSSDTTRAGHRLGRM
jgi:hypothetical protein